LRFCCPEAQHIVKKEKCDAQKAQQQHGFSGSCCAFIQKTAILPGENEKTSIKTQVCAYWVRLHASILCKW
jgi:hypothetical protein